MTCGNCQHSGLSRCALPETCTSNRPAPVPMHRAGPLPSQERRGSEPPRRFTPGQKVLSTTERAWCGSDNVVLEPGPKRKPWLS